MSNTKDLIDADGEVRELTAEDLEEFRPAGEALPGSLMTKLKVPEGWQTPADAAPKDWLKAHEPAESKSQR